MFDLMFPVFQYDESQGAGTTNPGGGMATKMKSLDKVLNERYFFNWINGFSQVTMPIVIIDPLVIRLNAKRPQNMDLNAWTAKWVEDLSNCPAKKILYCSEMEIARWSPKTFAAVIENVDIVTANTNYQKELIWTLANGQCYPHHLCDPIDEEFFHPAASKKTRIFSAGRIAKVKGSEFLVDVFRAVKKKFGADVETAYFGNAALWGNADTIDDKIADEIKQSVDFYLGGINRGYLARLFGESLVYVSKTKHDVYSSTHVEILASAVISLGGGHPFYKERPGISGLTTVESYIHAIEKLLNETPEQLQERQAKSREYVLNHCGFEAFHKQLKGILEMVR